MPIPAGRPGSSTPGPARGSSWSLPCFCFDLPRLGGTSGRTHLPAAFMTSGGLQRSVTGTHLPFCSVELGGQLQLPGTAPGSIGGGQMQVPLEPGTCGDVQRGGPFTQVAPSSTVPCGQRQEPRTGPGDIGAGQTQVPSAPRTWGAVQTGVFTQAPFTSTVPPGQPQLPSAFMTCGAGQAHEPGLETVTQALLLAALPST